jgi:hypothetical protein
MIKSITPQELYTQLTTTTSPFLTLQLIDVRNHDEIEADGKIKGAVNLPYPLSKDQPKLFNAVLADLDRTRPVSFIPALKSHPFYSFTFNIGGVSMPVRTKKSMGCTTRS